MLASFWPNLYYHHSMDIIWIIHGYHMLTLFATSTYYLMYHCNKSANVFADWELMSVIKKACAP